MQKAMLWSLIIHLIRQNKRSLVTIAKPKRDMFVTALSKPCRKTHCHIRDKIKSYNFNFLTYVLQQSCPTTSLSSWPNRTVRFCSSKTSAGSCKFSVSCGSWEYWSSLDTRRVSSRLDLPWGEVTMNLVSSCSSWPLGLWCSPGECWAWHSKITLAWVFLGCNYCALMLISKLYCSFYA